jgi:hypothetical protein
VRSLEIPELQAAVVGLLRAGIVYSGTVYRAAKPKVPVFWAHRPGGRERIST